MILKKVYILSLHQLVNLGRYNSQSYRYFKKSDIILCEDTRHSMKLLNNLNIKNKLISYHKFNEKKSINKIIQYLNEGKILSLISDAGTPVLSDPGKVIINECVKHRHDIFTVPGPSSITAAASLSGYGDQFLFYGFLPKNENELIKCLKKISDINFSLVFFIPAVKINFYLKSLKRFFSGRDIFIAREMTKKHETYYRGSIETINLFDKVVKGELTIVLSKIISKQVTNNRLKQD